MRKLHGERRVGAPWAVGLVVVSACGGAGGGLPEVTVAADPLTECVAPHSDDVCAPIDRDAEALFEPGPEVTCDGAPEQHVEVAWRASFDDVACLIEPCDFGWFELFMTDPEVLGIFVNVWEGVSGRASSSYSIARFGPDGERVGETLTGRSVGPLLSLSSGGTPIAYFNDLLVARSNVPTDDHFMLRLDQTYVPTGERQVVVERHGGDSAQVMRASADGSVELVVGGFFDQQVGDPVFARYEENGELTFNVPMTFTSDAEVYFAAGASDHHGSWLAVDRRAGGGSTLLWFDPDMAERRVIRLTEGVGGALPTGDGGAVVQLANPGFSIGPQRYALHRVSPEGRGLWNLTMQIPGNLALSADGGGGVLMQVEPWDQDEQATSYFRIDPEGHCRRLVFEVATEHCSAENRCSTHSARFFPATGGRIWFAGANEFGVATLEDVP